MATKPTKSPSETWAKLDAFSQRIVLVCATDERVIGSGPVKGPPHIFLPWLVRAMQQRDRHAFRGDVGASILDLLRADVARIWSDHDGKTLWSKSDIALAPPVQGERAHWMILDPVFVAWVKEHIDLSGQRKAPKR